MIPLKFRRRTARCDRYDIARRSVDAVVPPVIAGVVSGDLAEIPDLPVQF